ncbi:hypothetical protein L596_021017 [Steinernema carpocapsae]|uniref:Uncharacterized protein n=1 Tax=Steinernema carpocapsae TaxID=34508 RepID=A0A4U5MV86_STECR|nr:hypothetical protein L596_021017 [Steinernema carpocapsae]
MYAIVALLLLTSLLCTVKSDDRYIQGIPMLRSFFMGLSDPSGRVTPRDWLQRSLFKFLEKHNIHMLNKSLT